MADLSWFAEKVLPAAASGVSGVIVATWRLTRNLGKRLDDIENAWKQFSDKDYPRDQSSWGADIKRLQDDINASFKEVRRNRGILSRVLARYSEIERRLTELEKSIENLGTQSQDFAREQGDQWQKMIRVLGQLEGYLLGMRKHPHQTDDSSSS